MDVIDRVAQDFSVDRAKAEKGVGAVLSAFRLTADAATWQKLKSTVPDAESYITRSQLPSGGRTAEMAAIIAPSTLLAALASQGWRKEDIPRLVKLVIDHVRPAVGDEGLKRFIAAAPGLS